MLGELGHNIIFKPHKIRWTIELLSVGEKEVYLKESFCKVGMRPIEETVLSATTWIPSGEWQSITFTLFDATDEELKSFYGYCYNYFINPEEPPLVLCTGKLKMYSGCGTLIETWVFKEAWVSEVNFGYLDHSSCEIPEINVTLKYKTVECKNKDT